MAFNTPVFLFFFLPVSLLLYYLPLWGGPGSRSRQVYLLLISLFFYSWGEPKLIFLLAGSILVNYLLLRLWERANYGRALLIVSVLLNIMVLVWGKYFAASLPLGLSFYTFKLLSAWFDRKRLADAAADAVGGTNATAEATAAATAHKNAAVPFTFIHFALYISFYPQVISGPIGRYEHFVRQLPNLQGQVTQLATGLPRFLSGLFIKVLLADPVFAIRERLLTNPGAAEAWLAALLYTFYIYLDFSAYSDMAIALGRMLGFETLENFRLPYQADSVSDFWRRWHISLSSWFRDYVYIPLGGNRKGTARQILNILIVWSLTGIWHGSSLNFLFWGLYYAAWLLLEKFLLNRWTSSWPQIARQALTFLIVNFGWVLFAFPNFGALSSFVGALFGRQGAGGPAALYQLGSHALLLIVAAVFVFGLHRKLTDRWNQSPLRHQPLGIVLQYTAAALLMLLTIAFMLDQSFASFLYFNF